MEKKYCSGCQKDKAVDLFTEPYKMCNRCREKSRRKQQVVGHDLSEFYEGGLEQGGFSKLNLRKVRRRPGGGGGGGGGADEH